jgi:hypothetical protein
MFVPHDARETFMNTRYGCKWLAVALGLVSSLTMAPVHALPLFEPDFGPTEGPVPMVEYHNALQDHYFVTGAAQEIALLDTGNTGDWSRRGNAPAFMAMDRPYRALHLASGNEYAQPVCRFFIPPASHFLSVSADECAQVATKHPEFVLETSAAFYAWLPDPLTGKCPVLRAKIGGFEFQPVYRLWNGRADTNHRLTVDKRERTAMVANGWVAEGYGDDGVAMCVPHWHN